MVTKTVKKDGKIVGFTLIAENEEDRLCLGSIRNMAFFGFNETALKYAGMSEWKENNNYVQQLAWIQKGSKEEFNFSKLDENMNFITIKKEEEQS